jgi:hypothetical protein
MSVKIASLVQVPLADYPANLFDYPVDADVSVTQNEAGQIHDIYHSDLDPNTNFSTAPAGSSYTVMSDESGADSDLFWIKTGARGSMDGLWVSIGPA